MPPIALSPDETFEYELKRDAGKDKPRRFTLKVLSRDEERQIAKAGTNGKGEVVDVFARLELGLSLGLKGWNLTDSAGNPRPCEMPGAIALLNPYDRLEIFRAIETRGEDGVADIKSD